MTIVPVGVLAGGGSRAAGVLDAVRDAVAQQVLEGAASCGRARRGRFRSSRRRCPGAPACRFPWRPGAPRGRGGRTCLRTRPCACAAGRPAGRASGAPGRPGRLRSPARVRCSVRCTVATSLTDSAIMRVSSWNAREAVELERVEAPATQPWPASRRECICAFGLQLDVAQLRRRRSRLSVRSPSELLAAGPRSASMPRARDDDLAGLVDQAVEQLGADAHGLARNGAQRRQRGRRRQRHRAAALRPASAQRALPRGAPASGSTGSACRRGRYGAALPERRRPPAAPARSGWRRRRHAARRRWPAARRSGSAGARSPGGPRPRRRAPRSRIPCGAHVRPAAWRRPAGHCP